MQVELSLNLGPYVDYSSSVDVDSLKRNVSLNGENDPQRSQTGEIEVFGAAYTLVYNNLINSANLYSNAIYVRVIDTDCTGSQYDFRIDNRNLRWCDNNECRLRFSMDEYAPELDCIKNTAIADNTNGDFQQYPVSGNPHPRFRYCDVLKPTWFFGIMVTFFNSIDLLILSINLLINSLNIIITSLGFGPLNNIPFTYDKFTGCDRGWPAPFIRTYIDNVCDICGVNVGPSTDPVHFDTADPLNPLAFNHYYNSTLLTAYTKKGVAMVGAQDYIPNNRPSWTLFTMMSKIKDMWNARWYLKGGNLYFHRKDLISDLIYGSTYGIDLTGTDGDNVLGDVCFSWNGQGKPRRIYVKYSPDATDNIGNELLARFNGEYLDTSGNPNYTADVEVPLTDFGAPAFVLDGQDTLYDANIVNAIGAVLSGFNFKGCLKTQGDTLALAKVLVYDDNTPIDDARAVSQPWTTYIGCEEFADDTGGFFPVTTSDLEVFNYPMSFSPCQDTINPDTNLWPYWEIEKPDPAKKTNIGFEFKLQYCCAYNTLDLFMRVLFKDGVTVGEINSIDFDHATREITIKGNLV